jgi:hypothetical protein
MKAQPHLAPPHIRYGAQAKGFGFARKKSRPLDSHNWIGNKWIDRPYHEGPSGAET